ncbi:MAG: DUF3450 family protein [Pseudomonadota bacterium]
MKQQHIARSPRLTAWRLQAAAVFSVLLLAFQLAPVARSNDWRELDALVRQWTTLEQQISTVENQWRVREPLLKLQLELLQAERQTLSEFLEVERGARSEVDQRRIQLAAQQQRLEQAQQALREALDGTLTVLTALHERLPPPLNAAWQAHLDTLAAGDALSDSERLQQVVGMLSEAAEFDQRITLHQTTMTDDTGTRYAVQQVFLGLSQGWYTSEDGAFAGFGRAEADGWRWRGADQIPELDPASVLAAVRMLGDPTLAAPVTLPIELESP